MGAIVGRALVRLTEVNPRTLVNTVWAVDTLGVRQAELLRAIAGRVLVRIEECDLQDLANMA